MEASAACGCLANQRASPGTRAQLPLGFQVTRLTSDVPTRPLEARMISDMRCLYALVVAGVLLTPTASTAEKITSCRQAQEYFSKVLERSNTCTRPEDCGGFTVNDDSTVGCMMLFNKANHSIAVAARAAYIRFCGRHWHCAYFGPVIECNNNKCMWGTRSPEDTWRLLDALKLKRSGASP